jgi:hypothetical protein
VQHPLKIVLHMAQPFRGVRPAGFVFCQFSLRFVSTITGKSRAVLRPSSGGPMERRSGKNRRQYVDPRYGSTAYPEFVDRRKGGDRRKLDYRHVPGHPVRKSIMLMGLVGVVLLIALLFFLSAAVSHKSTHKTVRKKTITFGHYQHDRENHAWAMPPLSPL